MILLYAITMIVCNSCASSDYTIDWRDKPSVINYLAKIAGKQVIYSQFDYYPARNTGELESKYKDFLGQDILIYGLDFYYASGTWFPHGDKQKCRDNIISIVKKAWAANRAIPCFSWHLENPYTPSSFGEYMGCRYRYLSEGYPLEHRYVIKEIIDGRGNACGQGSFSGTDNTYLYKNPRAWFEDRVKEVADIINSLKDEKGHQIPCILRLWHESDGDWQWWGRGSVTTEDYKAFYKLTKALIEKNCNGAQILWAYSLDRYWKNETEFLSRYPGDDCVDIIGFDDYSIGTSKENLKVTIHKAAIVSDVARKHKKIAALFETDNVNKESYDTFFSDYLNAVLESETTKFSIVQIWNTGKFSSIKEREDRKNFLLENKVLKVKRK